MLQSKGPVHVWYDDVTNLRYEWNPKTSHVVYVFVRVRSPEDRLAYVLIDSIDTTFAFQDPLQPRLEEVTPLLHLLDGHGGTLVRPRDSRADLRSHLRVPFADSPPM
jgi:hypothetical protein